MRSNTKGFTLVELLVVILILAILMAVALPLYLGAVKNSEKGAARANMQTIANAMQSARLKDPNRAYPATIAALYAAGDVTAINGPGNRQYELVAEGTSCDADGNATTPDQAVPAGGFGVRSTGGPTGDDADGCFIPGISAR